MTPSPGNAAPPARMRIGTGRVLMWQGGSLWIGRDTGQTGAHAHHAIQLTLAPREPVRLGAGSGSDGGDGDWRQVSAAIVMPDAPHRFDGLGRPVAMVFVEPETIAGRALLARFGSAPLSLVEDAALLQHAHALLDAFDAQASDEALMQRARGIVAHLAGGNDTGLPVDRRIAAVLAWVHARLDAPIELADAAAVAHLSPSRFRHLFVEHTGISFRAYLLWSRVSQAMARGMAGESWTEAAQQVGFADSAHLSRTCRRMFGIAPSMLERE